MTISLAVPFLALVLVAIIVLAIKPAILRGSSPQPDAQAGEFLAFYYSHPVIPMDMRKDRDIDSRWNGGGPHE